MKLTSSGESHGKSLNGILENVPSNLSIDVDKINYLLSLRQSGYGRGARQKIEKDKITILSGVRNKITLGSPLCFAVENKDYSNWSEILNDGTCDVTKRVVTKVRPGHADLTGMIKFDKNDARDILERASARETAIRVAAGAIAMQFLETLGVETRAFVRGICGVVDTNNYSFSEIGQALNSDLLMLDKNTEKKAKEVIDNLKADKDTGGGLIEIRVKGLKSGFGSCMNYSEKLDAQLASAIISVQAVKGVEFGDGFDLANKKGSEAHDEIFFDGNKIYRKTNRAGGIEGGMSNGEEIIIKAVMKPIPTLMKGLNTIDFITKEAVKAATERSDVTAVPACAIILESVVALVLSEVIQKRLGGDNMREIIERWKLLK